jgi:hypothetical protein
MTNASAVVARAGALVVVGSFTALLHHGHIAFFLTDVRARVGAKGGAALRGARIEQEASRLHVSIGDPATQYEVSVHRKTRSVDVALCLDGSADENEAVEGALSDSADAIRAKLGRDVELEALPSHHARLVRRRRLSDDDWSPKRDLTPAVVRDTSDLLLRFIRTLQPILRKARADSRR